MNSPGGNRMSAVDQGTETTRRWKLSLFTSVVSSEAGDNLLLHNSFMGAIARVTPRDAAVLGPYIQRGYVNHRDASEDLSVDPAMLSAPAVQELCRGGFFVPADLDERALASEILDSERDRGFTLFILPHENCNFRCTYCYETFERGLMPVAVRSALKRFVQRKASEVGDIAVSWFGGEPLIARSVLYDLSDSFMQSVQAAGGRYVASITTNGFLLTLDTARQLLQRQVKRYQVTIDGPQSTHDASRRLAGGGGTYGRIIANLSSMRSLPDDFHVRIRVNFDKANSLRMAEFFETVSPLFAGDERFSVDFHPVGKWGGPHDGDLDVCDAESVEEVRLGHLRVALEAGFSAKPVKESLSPHGNVCYAGRANSIVVRSDGVVCKCTVAFEDPINHVGSITSDGDLVVDDARWALWTELDDKDAVTCRTCSFSPTCQGRACPLIAIKRNELVCPMTRSEFDARVRLVSTFAGVER